MKHARRLLLACALLTVAGHVRAQERIQAEAYAGQPFGVGRVTIGSGGPLRVRGLPRAGGGRIAELARRIASQDAGAKGVDLASAELALVERNRRVFYPVFEKRQRPILQQFINLPGESTVYFLFKGDAPLDLTVYAPEARGGQVVPRHDPQGHARLLQAWWRDYASVADGRDAAREYPQMVEEYLTDTLARRLRLDLPRRQQSMRLNLLRGELNLLFETETARLELAEAVLLGDLSGEAATVTLAEELPAPRPGLPEPPPDVPIEPLAMRVPVECLYVRFGSFPNFLWLQHRLEDWGGELRDVVSERGLDFGLNNRFQKQLGLRPGAALAEIFGDKVIADVALIGTDTLMHEGAAIGILFHAKSNAALANDLTQQRRASLREAVGGQEEKLTIAGKQVSYVSTPDGALRSYYAVDGDYHLVTTCRQIVAWFLETADGRHPSLGASAEFLHARAAMPVARGDTVFVYLSPQFFENLLSAPYQIESKRRLRSAVEIELAAIAQLAAKGEANAALTIDELVAADLLPAGFGQHADGSRLVREGDRLVDSLRGTAGAFVPVPDMRLGSVTPSEADDFRQFQTRYAENWGAMDPLVLGIRREELPEGKLERVVLDVKAAPLAARHLATLSNWLGEPTLDRLAPLPGDVVSFDAVVRGGTFFSGGDHRLFGALRNADPAIALDPQSGLIARILKAQLQGLQGYLGAWPHPGYLRLIGGAAPQQPDAAGYARLPLGMWRRQFDQFTLMSFHPEILAQISPELRFVKAQRPAQVRLHVDDLAHSSLAPLINGFGYRQARKISEGNTRFMNMLVEQLRVPPAEALETGQRLLGATFVAPLGGSYELRRSHGGPESWIATALVGHPDASRPPDDYQYRALTWLRGADFELLLDGGEAPSLSAHGEFIMPVEHRAPAFQLPKLPFLSKPAARPEAAKPAEEQPAPTRQF